MARQSLIEILTKAVVVTGVCAVGISLSTVSPAKDQTSVNLRESERSVFSQFGEDGVIEKIFEIIEPTEKYAVEFGAGNGVRHSNVRNLFLDKQWSGLLIEGDPKLAGKMKAKYKDNDAVTALEAWVYPGNIEILFEENRVPQDLDFLVIDIDSNDYYVWRAIQNFRPKVVQIEANPAFAPPEKMVVEFDPNNYWDGSDYYGASAQSLYELAKQKGYELVYHSSRGNNLFFVREEYYDRFGIQDNSPTRIYTPVHVFRKNQNRPDYLPVSARKIPKRIVQRPLASPTDAKPVGSPQLEPSPTPGP